jgi:transposase
MIDNYAALIGIDWSDQKHDACLLETSTGRIESSVVKHSAEALQEWISALHTRFPNGKIAVCLEQSRGPLIYALLKYDFITLYPVNPKTLCRYREALTPSRAKDDPQDARYLLELLTYHHERLQPWHPADEKTRTLQYLVEHRRRLVNDRTRISNRLTALLKSYFPQVLDCFDQLATTLVCDFLLRWTSLEEVQRSRAGTLERFFRQHNSVRLATNQKRIKLLKEAVALVNDRAVINSSVLMCRALSEQMKVTIAAIAEFDREIEALCLEHPDYLLFDSMPGAGAVYSSRLIAAFGSERSRYGKVEEFLCYCGVAPVLERSGKQSLTRYRYFCPKFLRQSFVEYAGESIKHSFWARAYYNQQRAKGKRHQTAVRALAYKWIRIMYRCWQTRTPYSEVRYLESLRRKGSSLLSFVASNQN